MYQELPDVQTGFRKGRGTRDQIANNPWIIEKASSVKFSSSAVSNSLWPHGLQHTRPPYPSWVYSNSCPLSRWCHPTISSSVDPFSSHLKSFPASGFFQWVSSSHELAKVLEFQLQHQPFNEYSELIFFRMDWLDLLAVQGTLKSLLQHHISKASILRCSAFFLVQLSHPYMTTGKAINLTRWTFVGKVMLLLFNMISSLIITFLQENNLLIYWLFQSIWLCGLQHTVGNS